MATITNASINIIRQTTTTNAQVIVKGVVNFSPIEYCMMKNCSEAKMFKVQCELWGEDIQIHDFLDLFQFGQDDKLFTYNMILQLPKTTAHTSEDVVFDATINQGVLNEDSGQDEVYGKIVLTNLFTGSEISKTTPAAILTI